MERKFEAERVAQRAGEQGGGVEAQGSVGTVEDRADANAWRKKVNVFNWFDEARSQLQR